MNRSAMSSRNKWVRRKPRPAAGAASCPAGGADPRPEWAVFFLQSGTVPDIRCGRFEAFAQRSQGSAAIAQLVEHVIRNDGVTGSNPVCGTASPSSNIPSHPENQHLTGAFDNLSSEAVRDELLVSGTKCWYIRWYLPPGMEM